jgi:serralysin
MALEVWKSSFSIPTGPAGAARVASLGDGRIAMVWQEDTDPGPAVDMGLRLRLLDIEGNALGPPLMVGSSHGSLVENVSPDIAALSNGGFALSFREVAADGSISVAAQIFAANGAPVANHLSIANGPSAEFGAGATITHSVIKPLGNGAFMVAYVVTGPSAANPAVTISMIKGHIVDANQTVSAEMTFYDAGGDRHITSLDSVVTGNGNVVFQMGLVDNVASERPPFGFFTPRSNVIQVVAPDGTPVNSILHLASAGINFDPTDLTALANGNFAATDYTTVVDNDSLWQHGVYAPDGTNLGGGIHGPGAFFASGAIVPFADGSFGAFYTEAGFLIFYKHYSATGVFLENVPYDEFVYGDVILSGDGRSFVSDGGGNLTILDSRGALISGTDSTDYLTARQSGGTVDAGAGDDFVYGQAGVDNILGGLGNDVLRGGGGNDTLDGGGGNDTIDWSDAAGPVIAALSATGGGTVTAAGIGTDTFSNFENMTGGGSNDTLTGNDAFNIIKGGAGDDMLNGAGGPDTLIGGLGNDRIDGGTGSDLVDYSAAVLALYIDLRVVTQANTGGFGTDLIISIESVRGGAGSDTLIGNNDANSLFGGAGSDSLVLMGGADYGNGDAGNDYLSGRDGNDALYGALDEDILDGGAGFDFLYGGAGNDYVIGGTENDTIYGGDGAANTGDLGDRWLDGDGGDDVIYGNLGTDRLSGGIGNDVLTGGEGFDYLTGEAGIDTFVYNAVSDGSISEQIGDWQGGVDRLRIDASAFGGGLTAGLLAANRLVIGTAANQAFGQFLYNAANGVLYWDADGTGAGSAVAFTRLFTAAFTQPPAALAAGDFDIVA